MSKRIAARHLHPTDFDHEHARGDFSGHEQRLILAVALQLAEAEEPVDFRTGEFWKHPFVARIESRHGPSSRVQHNPVRKVSRVSATACGSGQGRYKICRTATSALSLWSRMECASPTTHVHEKDRFLSIVHWTLSPQSQTRSDSDGLYLVKR